MKEICKSEKCTGCGACYNKCPKGAITFVLNDGFYYPSIDEKKCIHCNLCVTVCPANNAMIQNKVQNNIAYACINKKKNIRDRSSSGGVFFELAAEVISNNGVVFGARWNKNKVEHFFAERIDDVCQFHGSKYLQSDTNDTFKKVEEYLEMNRAVLFSGVACQIAGLYGFLKGKNIENLVTCEVLCHGGGSPKVFCDHIDYLENKFGKEITGVDFRAKEAGCRQGIRYNFSDGESKIIKNPINDFYYNGFLSGILLRKSCYCCDYTGIDRIADVTLADFWGLKENALPAVDDLAYPSLVLCNNEKGLSLWKKIQDRFFVSERTIEEAVWGNLAFRRSIPRNRWRRKFFDMYSKKGYREAAEKCLVVHRNYKDWIKLLLGKKITNILLKVLKR